jgi:hypothetical protein
MAQSEVRVAEAATQLAAYERAARAVQAGKEGPLRPPITLLSDEQLAALFAPRQLDLLVRRPLGPPCQEGQSDKSD